MLLDLTLAAINNRCAAAAAAHQIVQFTMYIEHIDVFLTAAFSYGQRCQHFEVTERLFVDYGIHSLLCMKVTTFEKMTV